MSNTRLCHTCACALTNNDMSALDEAGEKVVTAYAEAVGNIVIGDQDGVAATCDCCGFEDDDTYPTEPIN